MKEEIIWECANANCSASYAGFRPSRCQECGSEEFYCPDHMSIDELADAVEAGQGARD